eukprot:2001585-Prymnesium_polylepis.1
MAATPPTYLPTYPNMGETSETIPIFGWVGRYRTAHGTRYRAVGGERRMLNGGEKEVFKRVKKSRDDAAAASAPATAAAPAGQVRKPATAKRARK